MNTVTLEILLVLGLVVGWISSSHEPSNNKVIIEHKSLWDYIWLND